MIHGGGDVSQQQPRKEKDENSKGEYFPRYRTHVRLWPVGGSVNAL